jgi:hypothetical protein
MRRFASGSACREVGTRKSLGGSSKAECRVCSGAAAVLSRAIRHREQSWHVNRCTVSMLEQYARSMGLHPGLRRCTIIKGWAVLLTLLPLLTLFPCFNKVAVGVDGEVTHLIVVRSIVRYLSLRPARQIFSPLPFPKDLCPSLLLLLVCSCSVS